MTNPRVNGTQTRADAVILATGYRPALDCLASLAADRVPSVHAIRAQFHVGQPRAQRLRDYLAAGAGRAETYVAYRHMGLRVWHAVACLVLGFLLASTGAAPEISHLISALVAQVQVWLSGGKG